MDSLSSRTSQDIQPAALLWYSGLPTVKPGGSASDALATGVADQAASWCGEFKDKLKKQLMPATGRRKWLVAKYGQIPVGGSQQS